MQDKNNGGRVQLVVFKAGNGEFGAEIGQVKEIVKMDAITTMPDPPEHVLGIINLRGRILPVVSLRSLIGLPVMEFDNNSRIMVANCPGNPFGLMVDMVSEVRNIPGNMIEPIPKILRPAYENSFLRGIGKSPDGMLIIIDFNRIKVRNIDVCGRKGEPQQVENNMTNKFYIDALKEMGNIGTSHAATSLSHLTGKTINITVPDMDIDRIEKIGHIMTDASTVAGLLFELKECDCTSGYLCLMFPEKCALAIADILMGQEPGTMKELDDLGRSAIMEVGNILASSFCDALAELLGIVLLPSPPNFVVDMADSIIDPVIIHVGMVADEAILFRTNFSDVENFIDGYIMFIPDPQILDRILGILEKKASGQ